MSTAPRGRPQGKKSSCGCKNKPPGGAAHSGSFSWGSASGARNSFCQLNDGVQLTNADSKKKELAKKLKDKCGFNDQCAERAAGEIVSKIQDQLNVIARSPVNKDIPCGKYDDCGSYTGKPCKFSLTSDSPVDYTVTCQGNFPKVSVSFVSNIDTVHDCGKPWEPPGGWPPECSSVTCDTNIQPPPLPECGQPL